MAPALLRWGAPALFVLLWSTGFIGAKLGLPDAGPLIFLAVRFLFAAVLLAMIALLTGAPWPRRPAAIAHYAVAGLLVHGVYLSGVFTGIALGVAAGVVALIVGLQPLLVAGVAGFVLGERVTARQWLGLVLGFGGVVLVLERQLEHGAGELAGVFAGLVALVAITAGTLYQKRWCGGMDLRTGSVVQYGAAAILVGAAALAVGDTAIDWTPTFVFALLWLVVILSLGAISLFYALIRRGAATAVSSLLFLVPPTTALLAWPLFGETLAPLALGGMALSGLGVALVTWPRKS